MKGPITGAPEFPRFVNRIKETAAQRIAGRYSILKRQGRLPRGAQQRMEMIHRNPTSTRSKKLGQELMHIIDEAWRKLGRGS
jgi:hypothetical protein